MLTSGSLCLVQKLANRLYVYLFRFLESKVTQWTLSGKLVAYAFRFPNCIVGLKLKHFLFETLGDFADDGEENVTAQKSMECANLIATDCVP